MLICNRCGAEWVPRKVDGKPVQCPRCKRVDWQEPRRKVVLNGDVPKLRSRDTSQKPPSRNKEVLRGVRLVNGDSLPKAVGGDSVLEAGAKTGLSAFRLAHALGCPCLMCNPPKVS